MQELALARTGTALRQAREAAGLTQQAVASRAGIATRTVARIESGEDVRLGTLYLLATALGVTVADLVPAEAAS